MRVLITGITSIHGWPIFKKLKTMLPQESLFGIRPPKMSLPDDENVISLCITDKASLLKIKKTFKPTHVVHCAGVCDLDACEENPDLAYALNVEGAKAITEIFGEDSYILYLSSDLVFSGERARPSGYEETHSPDPISVAGKTFFLAEQEIKKNKRYCIVRLGLPLGDSVTGDKGAIDWVENRFKRNLPVTLFYDEYRSCISCEEIGENVIQFLLEESTGLYHYGGGETRSLYDIGKLVLKKGDYKETLLKGILRCEEKNGPPRIGNVALNSTRMNQFLQKSGVF
ncbi:SDR family oxidoreductase [Candidatus Auribacterota bacterium]